MRTDKMIRTVGTIGPAAGDEYVIEGVAVLFGQETLLVDDAGFRVTEEIAPEACDNALARPDDVRCLLNHDSNIILGRNTAGTLSLWKETDGLHFRATLDPEITTQADVWRCTQRGDYSQCSFAFTIDAEEKIKRDNGVHYIVRDLHLYDVSVVAYPAYSDTTAYARDAESAGDERRDNDAAWMTELLEHEISVL